MSGAGTNRTRQDGTRPGPVILLVEPQLPENIGMAARAMANFGLSELRLVAPRDGWPPAPVPAGEEGGRPTGAYAAAAGASHILDAARVFATLPEAIADLNVVYATTARERGQMKRVVTPAVLMPELPERIAAGTRIGILFGRERTGLENDEVALADAILTFPVNPAFASLNLAQAVLLVGYEWFKAAGGGEAPFAPEMGPPATREGVLSFFAYLEGALDAADFFPPDKRPSMARNLRDLFLRLDMNEQDLRTLRGAVTALVEGRRGGRNTPRPARAARLLARDASARSASSSEDGQKDETV